MGAYTGGVEEDSATGSNLCKIEGSLNAAHLLAGWRMQRTVLSRIESPCISCHLSLVTTMRRFIARMRRRSRAGRAGSQWATLTHVLVSVGFFN